MNQHPNTDEPVNLFPAANFLVIDDDAVIREAFRQLLSDAGHGIAVFSLQFYSLSGDVL